MATVKLKHITPLWVCSDAIRQCHGTQEKADTPEHNGYESEWVETGPKDKALIDRVGNKMKHASTLEHIIVQLDIFDISRALLQEWSRHRIGMSQTVKSSRYTLGELKSEPLFSGPFCDITDGMGNPTNHWNELLARASKYVVLTSNETVNAVIVENLYNLQRLVCQGISNDLLKYAMPDAYKTSLTTTINFRSLQNLLALRSAPSALWEFRELAQAIFEAIPEDYKFLLEDCIYKES